MRSIVGGTQDGHQHLDSKNHASKGVEKTFEGKSMKLAGGGRKKSGAKKMASMVANGKSK